MPAGSPPGNRSSTGSSSGSSEKSGGPEPRPGHVGISPLSCYREARGEPPPPDILDRILAWLPWGS